MSKLTPVVNNRDHIAGPEGAPIELVEYGDYECPHCGRAYPIIKSLQKKLGDKLKFVFRNFPLAEAHPDATHAAIATEVAGAHGKFWEMHDIVFENQESLEDVYLVRYAAKIGLDMSAFKSDFDDPQFREKVESDFESGIRSGVNGTPSFYINGQKFNGDWEEKHFLAYLQSILQE
jgi:protein-disulfide isomerase